MSGSLMTYVKTILGAHVGPDIVEYINSMKHEADLAEFMESILDRKNSSHIASYDAICGILFGTKRKHQKAMLPSQQNRSQQNVQQKPYVQLPSQSKGKKKFSNINKFEEKTKKTQGRTECDCEGQEHEFMNNCLNCGRIHCYEEGPGPCFFCQEPITLPGEERYVKAQKTVKNPKKSLVFDDDNDYFRMQQAKDSVDVDKKKLVVALDFASRKVIQSTAEDVKIKEKLHVDIKKHLENVAKLYKKMQKQSEMQTNTSENNDLVDLLVQMRHKRPVGREDLGVDDDQALFIDYGKVLDEDMIAASDHGLCLSMHQPYASLLVAGVKKHEGRNWKTNHRGRLWIAAAAKEPDEDEVAALEDFYRQYYRDKTLKFPRDYPTSCLLGCVFVEDCLDEENYCKQFPNGESSSPFVLICSNPIILPIFYPIVGQHKIYALDKELHNCAKLSIRHARYGVD